ncbi:hypothetical protein [uncultured Fibrobacter sp.]|uniref:hypothetical protein n=1 Tax=uncultured Fibrobacter sp. TaxID=261512 RepID=UPI0025EFA15B|nr:hypothetical protein [uncultured Fibrobacter sp.]
MRFSVCLPLLAAGCAFALNVDSLPVWNPDYLVRGNAPMYPTDTADNSQSRLVTHGYKTMQVTVGDGGTQVDQEMRLSVQGYLTDNVYVDALLSDVDRKAGEQTTATLQEVDQIYFRVESPHFLLHLGDFTWHDESMGLFGFERSTLGAMVGARAGYSEVRGAVGMDEVARYSITFNGVRGQREGYSLGTAGNYLSVVPGSEKVWLNGVELVRGKDYVVNYAGGLLDFKGTLVPGNDDEIRVDYDAYEEDNVYTMYAAKAKYRHPNVHMDVSGFRLESNVDRLKRNSWTDDDYRMLKNDDGGEFVRDDTLGSLARPSRTDRMGARLRVQGDHRFYADLETAMGRKDSNIVSDKVDGPVDRAFRWYVTSDSSYGLRKFPLAVSVYGNYIGKDFGSSEFVGSDHDWNSYRLNDEWDLDSSGVSGNLRHDELALRMRLWDNLFSTAKWGYRRADGEKWNSSRASVGLTHDARAVRSELELIRVASVQDLERTRYQARVNSEFRQGLVRPFGEMDFRYTESDSVGHSGDPLYEVGYGHSLGGLSLVDDAWTVREALGTKLAKKRERAAVDGAWEDSLVTYVWQQSADANWKYLQLNHMLQYEYSRLEEGDQDAWVGDVNANFGNRNEFIYGNVSYKLGMTEEQTYVSVYKAVAPGTGDVRYDSLTGVFIEGVDNGDFVYEGKGRNDSVGVVLASNSEFSASLEFRPASAFGIRHGILRDIVLGGEFSSVGEDTTGRHLYFPPLTASGLKEITSGSLSWEGRLEWSHPMGLSASYSPGADYEKTLSSYSYFRESFHHDASAGVQINDNHYVGATGQLETVDLTALQVLEWKTRDGSLRYRFSFLDGFHVEPGARLRYGDGQDGAGFDFDARLVEGSLRVGYDREEKVSAFVQFAAVQMESGGDAIPYQMMSGYAEGRTYRLEASLSLELNKNISVACHYVLRFGDAEENIFQKLSSEARAYF